MSEAELRLAVTGLAAEADLAVQPAVVEAVIAELREGAGDGLGSGVLPLMSQAMATTWEHREASDLTLRAYRRAGGVADAVNRGAQAAYDALTSRSRTRHAWYSPSSPSSLRTASSPGAGAAGPICAPRTCRSQPTSTPPSTCSAPTACSSSGRIASRFAMTCCCTPGNSSGTGSTTTSSTCVLYSQVATDGQIWDINHRDQSYLYRPGRLAAIDAATVRWRMRPPAIRRYRLPARRSCAPLITPQAAARGGDAP